MKGLSALFLSLTLLVLLEDATRVWYGSFPTNEAVQSSFLPGASGLSPSDDFVTGLEDEPDTSSMHDRQRRDTLSQQGSDLERETAETHLRSERSLSDRGRDRRDRPRPDDRRRDTRRRDTRRRDDRRRSPGRRRDWGGRRRDKRRG